MKPLGLYLQEDLVHGDSIAERTETHFAQSASSCRGGGGRAQGKAELEEAIPLGEQGCHADVERKEAA